MEMEIELESPPNTINSSALFAMLSTDKISVRYLGNQQHGHHVGVVQADQPALTRRAIYYFEMGMMNARVKGQTAIGFTTENFKTRWQPGFLVPAHKVLDRMPKWDLIITGLCIHMPAGKVFKQRPK